MTRLLIAFDGSDRAAESVLAAGRLFPGARAVVLSVANDPWYVEPAPSTALTLAGPAIPPAQRSGTSAARAIAERGCDLAEAAGLDAEAIGLPGERPAHEIHRAALRHGVDAIICGTHAKASGRRLLGSTALAVLRHARQPVLVVPATMTNGAGPMVIAYDGSDPARIAVRTAGRLLAGRDAVVVHAGSDSSVAREGAALARELGLRYTDLTVEPVPGAADALVRAARFTGAPLVIAGSRGRGAVAAKLLGSFSTALLREAAMPVLIAKAPA